MSLKRGKSVSAVGMRTLAKAANRLPQCHVFFTSFLVTEVREPNASEQQKR